MEEKSRIDTETDAGTGPKDLLLSGAKVDFEKASQSSDFLHVHYVCILG